MYEPHDDAQVIEAFVELRGYHKPEECRACCQWADSLPKWQVDAVMAEWYTLKGITPPAGFEMPPAPPAAIEPPAPAPENA